MLGSPVRPGLHGTVNSHFLPVRRAPVMHVGERTSTTTESDGDEGQQPSRRLKGTASPRYGRTHVRIGTVNLLLEVQGRLGVLLC